MSKGFKVVGIVTVVITVVGAALFAVSAVFAQPPTPDTPYPGGYGPGMMGGFRGGMMGGGFRGGMMQNGGGWMFQYRDQMHAAIAEALGISEADLEAKLADGQTMWQIAEEQGMSVEDLQETMQEAHNNALEQAVEDGVLTREQADWMQSHMASGGGYGGMMGGYGGANCPYHTQSGTSS